MAETRHFSVEATPDGRLEVDGQLSSEEISTLQAAWVASHFGLPSSAPQGLDSAAVVSLMESQKGVIAALQVRIVEDSRAPRSACHGNELKDVALAIAASIDKLKVLSEL